MEPSTENPISDPRRIFIETRELLKQNKALPIKKRGETENRLHSIGDNDYLQKGGLVTKVYELALNSYRANHPEGVTEALELFSALGYNDSEPVKKVTIQLQEWLSRQPRKKASGPLHGLKTRAALTLAGVTTLLASPGAPLSATNQSGQEMIPISPTTQVRLYETERQKSSPELFLAAMKPLILEAQERRVTRSTKEGSNYEHRVDPELNRNRVNILLFGYGEEHGQTYQDYGGSITIVSLNTTTGRLSSVSLSRDLRAPEMEQAKGVLKGNPLLIRQVYKQGGFPLMRLVTEDATGLAIDFQIALKDTVIRDLMQEIAGGEVQIDSLKEHRTQAFRLGGVEYKPNSIPAGIQTMDTEKAMAFILGEDVDPDGRKDERSYRKNIFIKALLKQMAAKIKKEPFTLFNLKALLDREATGGDIAFDDNFNFVQLGFQGAMAALGETLRTFAPVNLEIPESNPEEEVVIHDAYWGDGAVTRVHNLESPIQEHKAKASPEILEDIRGEKLEPFMLIPNNGNPYATDLPNDYWKSVRELVKKKLLGS